MKGWGSLINYPRLRPYCVMEARKILNLGVTDRNRLGVRIATMQVRESAAFGTPGSSEDNGMQQL